MKCLYMRIYTIVRQGAEYLHIAIKKSLTVSVQVNKLYEEPLTKCLNSVLLKPVLILKTDNEFLFIPLIISKKQIPRQHGGHAAALGAAVCSGAVEPYRADRGVLGRAALL